jgi:isopentenyl phosphate kinase
VTKGELTLVKLGGSLITNKAKPYTAKPATIKRLAQEIKRAWNRGFRFIISHGSGSFGHTSAAKYQTAEGIKSRKDVYGLAVVQQDAIKINRIVNRIFLEEGLPCLSFIPSSFSLANNKELSLIFTKPIIQALKVDALPLVFGDVILDEKIGCCIFSGEKTLDNLITPLSRAGFKITRIIQCGVTDGVYDGKGKTISLITPTSFSRWGRVIKGSSQTDVTGGMAHKVEECLRTAKQGVESLIINGKTKDNLLRAVMGKEVKGTLIRDEPKKTRSF